MIDYPATPGTKHDVGEEIKVQLKLKICGTAITLDILELERCIRTPWIGIQLRISVMHLVWCYTEEIYLRNQHTEIRELTVAEV